MHAFHASCLCGAVRFSIDQATPPFELCHCNRCRKVSGSAFMAGLGVRRNHFHWHAGQHVIRRFEAELIDAPPAYKVCFCGICGSPVPDPDSDAEWFEIPAGLLDDNPALHPDKHIYVEHKAPWHEICDDLPQMDKLTLQRHREGEGR